MVAHECLHSKFSSRREGVVCKLDFQKTYDRIDWSSLEFVMARLGVGRQVDQVDLASVSSAHLSIMVNGSPRGFFHVERGIRQCDHLTPFLYVLVAESLHTMLKEAKDRDPTGGFMVENSEEEITHIHYADNTILFLNANAGDLSYVASILKWF